MKKSTFRSTFFSQRVLIALLVCAAAAGLTSSGTLLALSQHELAGRVQRTLTLQERVVSTLSKRLLAPSHWPRGGGAA
jgi:hypothetical protein